MSALALLALAPAGQAKVVVDAVGLPGPQGGQFVPWGVAINDSGAGGVPPGTIYVSDRGPNTFGQDANRIQRLDPEGDFERLWGFDVVQGGGTGFEICTVAAECKRGTNSHETGDGGEVGRPAGIAVNQSNGDVYVIGWTNQRIDVFDAHGNFLRAFGRDVVSNGGAGDVSEEAFEICTVASDCKAGLFNAEAGAISFGRAIAIDSSGHLWFANANNHRIEEFDAEGNFLAAYGWDVVPGGPEEPEKCTGTAVGACQAGTVGTEVGQFGGSAVGPNPAHLTVDAAGFVYAIDETNDRIQRFDPATGSWTIFAPDLLEDTGLPGLDINSASIAALPSGHVMLSARISGENRLYEFDEFGQLVGIYLAGAGLPRVKSLAVAEPSGAIHAAVEPDTGAAGTTAPGLAFIDDGPAPAPPGLALEPVSDLQAESATLNVTVDPGGMLVADCKFQYSLDQVAWKDLPEPGCASLDPDGAPQQLSEPLGGLEPGTRYFLRFGAGRYYHPPASVTSEEEEFTTLAEAPLVSDVGAAQVTDTSAYLAGEIKPRSQSHQYHFEYGTTEALGTSTPTVAGSGSQQRVVAHRIEGLQPQTTYHLKLVAENECGGPPPEPCVTESAIVAFRTRPSLPPDQPRAYEQVSPPAKNFSNADTRIDRTAVAADGGAVAFCAVTGFGEPPGQVGNECTTYRAARTPSGWSTRWLGEPYCAGDLDEDNFQNTIGGIRPALSANLDLAAVVHPESASCPHPPLDPGAPVPQSNLYRGDFRGASPTYDLLAPQPAFEALLAAPGGVYGAASADWSHLAYTSSGRQAPEAPEGDFEKVFDWHDGVLRLVSVDPAGNPFSSAARLPDDAVNGVSEGGHRVFFITPADSTGCASEACQIYMRQNNAITYRVSESECTSSCGAAAADRFLAATPSGARVAFMSAEKLTNADTAGNGPDLYLYTHTANPPANQNLTLLSADSEPADGTGAKVLGLLGMSEDGETAYFAAGGQLVEGGPTDPGPKLYRWRAGNGLDYLATLAGGVEDERNWSGSGLGAARGATRQVSPGGEGLIVHTTARIDRGADHDSARDVYRWSEADGWLCLSCQVPDAASSGEATFAQKSTANHYRRVMSEDGGRVFFTSFDPLAAGDTNESADLYEWREDGSLTLISSGTDSEDVQFLGVGATGRDVFFTTYERLVGWDTDGNADIYDARLGGGFDEPVPIPPPCEGEACRGAPSSAPAPVGAGSAAFQGPGNKRTAGSCRGAARRAAKLRRAGGALRRRAKRANPRQVKRLRRRAARLARKGKAASRGLKRCRRANARRSR